MSAERKSRKVTESEHSHRLQEFESENGSSYRLTYLESDLPTISLVGCPLPPSLKPAGDCIKKRAIMLPVGLIKQEQPRLPLITWTDLVFRASCPKPRAKVATTEAERGDGSLVVVSKLHPESSGCRLDKKNQKAKASPLRMDCIQDVAEGTQDSPPPKSHTVNPPSAPKSLAVQEKRAVRKILVDLRPILEMVMEPFSSPQEDPAETDSQTDGCLSPSAGDSSSKDLTAEGGESSTEVPAVSPGDGGIHKDVSLPPIVDLCKATSLPAAKTPKGSLLQLRETTQLQENNPPASPVPKPKIRTPISFPKITPLQEVRLEKDRSREPPAAPSPDFQLPTQLLLQKLQENTTSKDHLLITQALRLLRKELMADNPDLGDGDKSNHLPVLPRSNLWQSRTTDGRQKELNSSPEAAKRRPSKLIWHIGRSVVCIVASEQMPPDL